MSDIDHDARAMEHLDRLARSGRNNAAASPAAKQAARLVRAILIEVPGLDGMAQDGLCALIRAVVAAPESTREAFGYEPY